ncbi:hypothetical protein ACQ4PT_057625 [Festuca glaucescens]
MNSDAFWRWRFTRRGIRLTSMARRDVGYKSGKLILATSLAPWSIILWSAARSLKLLPMIVRTDESATYAASISLRLDTAGEENDAAKATARSIRPASSSRTGRKDFTRLELSSSIVQILRICRHSSPYGAKMIPLASSGTARRSVRVFGRVANSMSRDTMTSRAASGEETTTTGRPPRRSSTSGPWRRAMSRMVRCGRSPAR